MKIKCQHPKQQIGCSCCGGRGWIIHSYKARCCKRELWSRGWPFTVYDGKQYVSFNGVGMTITSLSPYREICDRCLEKGNK